MASYYYQEDNHYPNDNFNQTVSVSDFGGSTVDVSITQLTGSIVSWDMYLQRYKSGAWRDVGSRSGYVGVLSPSNRTFTDVMAGGQLRIRIYWKGATGGETGNVYIPHTGWSRP